MMSDLKKIAKLLGKRGGEATKAKLGSEHYRRIGKKRWHNKAGNDTQSTT